VTNQGAWHLHHKFKDITRAWHLHHKFKDITRIWLAPLTGTMDISWIYLSPLTRTRISAG